jgi:hypothetical protein
MPSGWVGLPQVGEITVSEYVAIGLPMPGVVVTCFVTGTRPIPTPSTCAMRMSEPCDVTALAFSIAERMASIMRTHESVCRGTKCCAGVSREQAGRCGCVASI